MRSPTEIIEKIDFEQIHTYMILTKWTYCKIIGIEDKSPSISELKSTAKSLLDEVYSLALNDIYTYHYARTGGFKAHYCPYDKELHLEFIIQYW